VTAGIAAGALPRAAFAQALPPELTLEKLGGNLVQIGGAGANVVVAGGPDGLLMVDGGLHGRSADLLKLVSEQWPGLNVDTLFNTNWRPEHTGSNTALRAAGARIITHENTKLWLGGDFFVEWEDRAYTPNPPEALPTETFYASGKTSFAGEEIEYGYLPRAHSDGDIYVFFRAANVLVASDVLSVGSYPIVDYATGGWIGGLEQATKMLIGMSDSTTRIVPAAGSAQTQTALQAQLQMCAAVRERVAGAFRRGMSLKDFMAAKPTAEFDAQWGDPAQFLALVYKGAWGHIRELGGTI